MSNLITKTTPISIKNLTLEKSVIMTKLTEILSQESLITPDEKAKLLTLIRKEKDG